MKYFVKLDSAKRPVPNSLIKSHNRPKVGFWLEIFKPGCSAFTEAQQLNAPKECYNSKHHYFFLVDDTCEPVITSNITTSNHPKSGDYIEFFPPCLNCCSEIFLDTQGTPHTLDYVQVTFSDNTSIGFGMGPLSPFHPDATLTVKNTYLQEVADKVATLSPDAEPILVKDGKLWTSTKGDLYVTIVDIQED